MAICIGGKAHLTEVKWTDGYEYVAVPLKVSSIIAEECLTPAYRKIDRDYYKPIYPGRYALQGFLLHRDIDQNEFIEEILLRAMDSILAGNMFESIKKTIDE